MDGRGILLYAPEERKERWRCESDRAAGGIISVKERGGGTRLNYCWRVPWVERPGPPWTRDRIRWKRVGRGCPDRARHIPSIRSHNHAVRMRTWHMETPLTPASAAVNFTTCAYSMRWDDKEPCVQVRKDVGDDDRSSPVFPPGWHFTPFPLTLVILMWYAWPQQLDCLI